MRIKAWGVDMPPVPPPVRAAITETLSPENLEPKHLDALKKAITNVLNTQLAELTFAEIVDGLPTYGSFVEFHSLVNCEGHPMRDHKALCDGAVDKVRAFRSTFDPLSLKFNPCTLQGFQNEAPGSRGFHLRLVEMVVVACHQIAAFLSELPNNHRLEYDAWVTEQQRLKDAGDERYRYRPVQPPVAFYHQGYRDHEQYPRGAADVVGYWAETKIFGGVVLFDRGEFETECREMWLHAAWYLAPKTLFPPTAEQFQNIVLFFESDTDSVPHPFPLRATKYNRPRYYHYHAAKYFHIFRDPYDHRLPAWLVVGHTRSGADFPELDDQLWLMNHEYKVACGEVERDEAAVAAAKESMKIITPSSPLWRRTPGQEYW